MTRRDFIGGTLLGLGGFPLSVNSAENSLQNAHLVAASKAKALNYRGQLVILLPHGSENNVEPVAELFSQLTDVEVVLHSVPVDDINTEMFLSAGSRQYAYDIALPATFGIPDLAEAGAILDLTAFQKKHEPKGFLDSYLYNLGDFYNNRFYGYQADGDAYLMFYNQLLVGADVKKKFEDQFGEQYRIPDTWEDLDKHMAFFHQPDKGCYGGALFRTSYYMAWEWWVRFHAKGLLPFDDDLVPKINHQLGVDALEEMILASKHLYPGAKSNGLFKNWEAFSEGKIYANIGWGGTQKFLNKPGSKVKESMLFAPTPGGQFDNKNIIFPYFNWGWNYTVASNAKHTELAYLFTLFASSPVPSTISVRASDGFFDPFREEHYHDPEIKETYSEDFLLAHNVSMRNCFPDFYMSGQAGYFGELRKYIAMAVDGDISAKMALNAVAKSWHRIHMKKGIKKQTNQWRFLKKRYPDNILKLEV